MKWLGVTMELQDPYMHLARLCVYTINRDKRLDTAQLADISLLESLFELRGVNNYDRVLIYDIEELDHWSNFRFFVETCEKYHKEWSIIKQDLHSDVEVPISYLTSVI